MCQKKVQTITKAGIHNNRLSIFDSDCFEFHVNINGYAFGSCFPCSKQIVYILYASVILVVHRMSKL